MLIILLSIIILTVCEANGQKKPGRPYRVVADLETQPVALPGDAADDPCIWINMEHPSSSMIIGTNKKQGIIFYNLKGQVVKEYPVGRVNNIDIRYGFPLGEGNVDILAGTNRSDSTVAVFGIDPSDGSLSQLLDQPIRPDIVEVYGLCMYHDKVGGRYFVFVTGTDGKVEQWELLPASDGKVSGRLVRSFLLKSQTEGCVADDEAGLLYLAEEDYGIWKMSADPLSKDLPTRVDSLRNRHLKADVEGLTIYYASQGSGYLIASSQGNNTYAVYRREGNNEYLGSFRIEAGRALDGTAETDGIDVTGASFGTVFPSGFFIAQDGRNEEKGKNGNQNFKVVSWEKIASQFDPPLVVDTVATKNAFGILQPE
jgi:3-phytase